MTPTSINRRFSAPMLLLILPLLLPAVPAALESDKEQPILVEADGADINDRTGISVYTGNVIITQGSIRLEADKVTITQRESESDHILAEGKPVKFQQQQEGQQEPIRGQAQKTEYYMDSEIVYMTGDAVLRQGKDTFKSDRITYDRRKAQVRAGSSAEGSQRVRISIQPRKKGSQ